MEVDHDHIVLSQQPAKTVLEVGEMAREVRGAMGPVYVVVTSFFCRNMQVSAGQEQYADSRQNMVEDGTCLTDFKTNLLHRSSCLGYIYLTLILRVGGDSERLGREFDGAAACIFRFLSFARGFFDGGAWR